MKTLKILFLAVGLLGLSLAQAQTNGPNLPSQILASAARTAATVNSSDITNNSWRGATVLINVSAYTSGTYTPHVQGKDPVSGTYYDVLVGPGILATGITVLKVYPGIVATPNAAANDILPQVWRVQLIGTASPSMTLSVGGNLIQ